MMNGIKLKLILHESLAAEFGMFLSSSIIEGEIPKTDFLHQNLMHKSILEIRKSEPCCSYLDTNAPASRSYSKIVHNFLIYLVRGAWNSPLYTFYSIKIENDAKIIRAKEQ